MKAVAALLSLLALHQGVVECSPRNNQESCISCPADFYLCRQHCSCVERSSVCDGKRDCPDGSDEEDCDGILSRHRCPDDEFTCTNGQCVKVKWLCDGDDDCGDRSDEAHCPQRNCSTGELQCDNGNCVSIEWKCDGDDDCDDGTDERCSYHDCKADQFQCKDGPCISMLWRCDGDVDCADKSDEAYCHLSVPVCGVNEFLCHRAQKCIWLEAVCDGVNDCGDMEDEEKNCGRCQAGEFNCTDGTCIKMSWKCDGDMDCKDNSDEQNCNMPVCTSQQFACTNKHCIDKKLRCDGKVDCSDDSDELGCRPKKCRSDHFRCDNGQCLGLHKVCNGVEECSYGSDENNCQGLSRTCENNGGCEHNCRLLHNGARCWCKTGYKLADDKRSCEDINECEFEGTCSQICKNTVGSFNCSCVPGYQLKPDGRGCKALGGEAYLIFTNRVDIRRVTPDKREYVSILKGLQNAIALDFHHNKGLVFWSDVTLNVIKRAKLDGTEVMDVVSDGLENPGGLAVDWTHDKLFWTDAGTSRIEVSNLDGSYRRVILWQNVEKPRAIAAHPRQGTIFWTDWGTTPKIERAGMDGSLRMLLANTSLFWPNGLTVDYAADRLYWADAKHHVIECANLDGSQRRTVISEGLPHPFALTIFEDELYWTDWYTKSINKANKFSGNRVETIRSSLFFPMDIHTMHPQRQPPAENKCGSNNGGCSHLCLPHESGSTCSCPTGLTLKQDRKHCAEGLDTFILFSVQAEVRRISLDVHDLTDVVIPLGGLNSVVGVEFDSETDSIFWSDIGADRIGTASWDGKNERVLVGSSLDSPSGIALDWIGRNLYWTDNGSNRIELCNIETSMRTVLIWWDLDHPQDIVVYPEKGLMFWSELGKSARIERAGMDGSNREVIIGHNTTWPNGLSIDYKGDRLYWVDAGTDTLDSCNLDGSHRRTIVSSLLHPFGVNVYETSVYWTDWETDSIHYADKDTGGNQGVLTSGFGHIMDLKVFHRKRKSVPSPCRVNNGGCSHICVLAPAPIGHSCACPTGLLHTKDGKNCQTEMKNFLIFTRRQDIRKISLEVEYFMDVVIPVGTLRNAIAIDVDIVEGKMYWTDTVMDAISRADLNGSNVEKVVRRGIHTAEGIAVDSVGRKIYWTDDGHNRIQVANLDGSMRSVLIYEDLDKPRAITLHYDKGYMFWTDWGKVARIERADMNGQNRRVLISESLIWPNGLTIDRPTNRIIWADAQTGLIECADMFGNHRRRLVSRVQHPYGLTVAGQYIYWTDWRERSIHRANKNLGTNVTKIRDNLPGIMDIHAVQVDGVETHVNRCGKNNGGCSHLCLPHPRGTTCACPTGLLMKEGGKTCNDVPSKYLLFAARRSIRRISLDTPDHTDVYLPLPDLHNVIALDFDYHDSMVYYTDVDLDVIRRASLNGSQWMETIIQKELATTDGLAVDWIARNLYWTDSGHDVIEVSRLDGSSRKTLIDEGLLEPRAIALFPRKGLMFWTDWGTQPKIERAYLDGNMRKVIVDTDLGFPNALSIDYDAMRLYWVDAELDKIETSDLAGRNRVTLIQQVPHPFGLTVFEGYIYWTDWLTEKVDRANKVNGKNRKTIQNRLEGLMDIHMVAAERQTGTNACSDNNGNCTHLCLARPDGYVCACPNKDVPIDRKCSTVPTQKVREGSNVDTDINSKHECSEEDKVLGVCEETDSSLSAADQVLGTNGSEKVSPYIAVAVVLGILLVVFLFAFVIWKRHRRRHYNVEEFSTLTYANPTYQKASTETINSENRTVKVYPRFGYHASDERLINGHSDTDSVTTHTETVQLMQPRSNTSSSDQSDSASRLAALKNRWASGEDIEHSPSGKPVVT